MHSQKANPTRLEPTATDLHLQIPLNIPDHRRRPRNKPRPVRTTVYFAEESTMSVPIRRVNNG
jgi:hypothetical protein